MRTRTVIGIVSALLSLSFFVAPVANAAPLNTDQIGAIANLLKSFGVDAKTISNVANILLDSTSIIGLQSAHGLVIPTTNPITSGTATTDKTPRIMEWWGKVNQHIDENGVWQTDPDGSSGANISALTYCKKWYPATISVAPYEIETISTWRAGGNTSAYSATVQSYKCVS